MQDAPYRLLMPDCAASNEHLSHNFCGVSSAAMQNQEETDLAIATQASGYPLYRDYAVRFCQSASCTERNRQTCLWGHETSLLPADRP